MKSKKKKKIILMIIINLLMISSIAKYNMAAYSIDWASNGKAISTAEGSQTTPQICGDGKGGAIIVWSDDRGDDQDIYAQRIDASGNTLWMDNGTVICNAIDDQYSVEISSDNVGGRLLYGVIKEVLIEISMLSGLMQVVIHYGWIMVP